MQPNAASGRFEKEGKTHEVEQHERFDLIELRRDTREGTTPRVEVPRISNHPEWDAICGDRIPTFNWQKFTVSSVFVKGRSFRVAKLVPPLVNPVERDVSLFR